ncbi:hypothetical protein NUACC21_58050 [Scytonema sp. NUACC21]
MANLDFDQMTRAELLAYVRQHPQDNEAFQRYMALLQTAPGRVRIPPDQIEAELTKRLQAG